MSVIPTSRRAVLATIGTVGVAGCTDHAFNFGDDPVQTTLGAVGIQNRHEDPHEVEFRVEWDGDVVHDQTYEIEGFDDGKDDQLPGETPERTWPEESGEFAVSARLAGEEWQSTEPGNWDHPECMGLPPKLSRTDSCC